MATNEIYKHGQWLSLPLPLRGDDPKVNEDPTTNGDPVLIGDITGFAQEVGGVPITYAIGSTTVTQTRNPANSLEPGWASVALTGAFAYPVEGWDPMTMGAGTPVGIRAAEPGVPSGGGVTPGVKAKLVANAAEDHWFGVIVGQTKLAYPVDQTDDDGNPIVVPEGTYVPIVKVVQFMEGRANPVPDKFPLGS